MQDHFILFIYQIFHQRQSGGMQQIDNAMYKNSNRKNRKITLKSNLKKNTPDTNPIKRGI